MWCFVLQILYIKVVLFKLQPFRLVGSFIGDDAAHQHFSQVLIPSFGINIFKHNSVFYSAEHFHHLFNVLPQLPPPPLPRLHDFKAGGAVNVNCLCYYSFRKQSWRSGLCHTAISLKSHTVSWGKPGEELHLECSRMSHLLYTTRKEGINWSA